MGFMIDTHDMPRIGSWMDADSWYKQTPFPIRRKEWAEAPNARPLSSIRMFHKRIVKNGDDYELTLYGTPLVTYHKDGTVTSIQYDTVSSQAFHWRVRPEGIHYRKASGGKILLQLNPGGSRFVEYVQGARIKVKCKDGVWTAISGTEQRTREFLKHKESREAAKKLKPLMSWYDASVKLGATFVCAAPKRHELDYRLHCLEDPEQYEDLAIFLWDKPKFRKAYYDALDLYEKRPIPNTEPPVRQRCWDCT